MSVGKKSRETVYVASEGKSAMSGDPLAPHWHVDHVVPRASGGTDQIQNLQALNPDENLAKSSASPPELRAWQERFLERYVKSNQDNFLLVALPGSGKTIAALTVAWRWIRGEPLNRKVLVVVPTDPLRRQWQMEAAQQFGLQFQTTEFTGWKPGMVGGIVTYQGICAGAHADLWKLRCTQHDVLVICDEVHHAGDQNDWGARLREAVGLARRRLLMSGTPFRSDSTKIPFVTYDGEGRCSTDEPQGFRYDYPSAIRDEVIRVVMFQYDAGVVRKMDRDTGEETVEELCSTMVEDDDADDIHGSLVEPGEYTTELLRRAHDQLTECRKTMPDAGGLVLCKTQRHAEQIASQLCRVAGVEPDVVVSDDDIATSTVEKFKLSTRPWVVAVRKISEGIDIKRLMVLVYLSNYRTQLAFRQAVGRIVRNLGTDYDQQSYCFIPAHPKLVRCAKEIVNAQDQAVLEDDEGEAGKPRKPYTRTLFEDVVLSTEHDGNEGAIIDGVAFGAVESERLREVARRVKCSEATASRFIQEYPHTFTPGPEGRTEQGHRTHERPLEQQLDAGRKAVHKAVGRAAFTLFSADDPKRFMKASSLVNMFIGKDRKQMTLDDCRKAIDHLAGLVAKKQAEVQ